MAKYRITIEGPNRFVTIECRSTYTLDVDLTAWVREEVDVDATFTFTDLPAKPFVEFADYNPPIDKAKCPVTKTAHVQRAGYKDGKEIEFCEECHAILRTVE